MQHPQISFLFFFNDTATTEIYTLSLHDALPISGRRDHVADGRGEEAGGGGVEPDRSEEHTSELQSHLNLVCRLLLEKKKTAAGDRRAGAARSALGHLAGVELLVG